MSKNQSNDKPAQLSLLLRVGAGGYLIYLGWGLAEVALTGGELLYFVGMVAFGLVGIALVVFSLPPLIKGDYLAPWQIAQMNAQQEEEADADTDLEDYLEEKDV